MPTARGCPPPDSDPSSLPSVRPQQAGPRMPLPAACFCGSFILVHEGPQVHQSFPGFAPAQTLCPHRVAMPVPTGPTCPLLAPSPPAVEGVRRLSGSTYRMFPGSDHLLPSCLPSLWPGLSWALALCSHRPLLAVLEPSEYPPPSSLLCLNLPWLTGCPCTLSISE